MKLYKKIILLIGLLSFASHGASQAQTYVKLNGLYALGGIINPAAEFTLSKHSTFQTELVISPWKSINYKGVGRPMLFGLLINEYRYYFRESNSGWYAGANFGFGIHHMTKVNLGSGPRFKDTSAKGYNVMGGISGGYEWRFAERWLLDAFVGFGYIYSRYNGYALVDGVVEGGVTYNRGEIIMTPNRSQQPVHPDPWNSSAEWIPYKIGVSIGFLINNPNKQK